MVAFTEAENREGKVDFGVDKGIKFTFEHVKFEVGQENTHELRQLGFLSLKLRKEFLLD